MQSLSTAGIQSLRSTWIQAKQYWNKPSRLAVILNERFNPHKQRLSSISTNEKRVIKAQQKILNHKRHQLTRPAPNYIVPNPRGQRQSTPPQAVNHASVVPLRGVGEVERDSQIPLYLSDRPGEEQ